VLEKASAKGVLPFFADNAPFANGTPDLADVLMATGSYQKNDSRPAR
jgi:hypothetical protein